MVPRPSSGARTQAARPVNNRMERLEWLSTFLDSSIPIGKTGRSIGLDPLLGLVPGIGDAVGAFLSAYIILEAARMGAPTMMLARMMMNVALESLIGIIPIFGDLFDFVFKANQRNLAMLKTTRLVAHIGREERRLWTASALVLAFVVVMATVTISVLVVAVKTLSGLLAS